MLEEKFSSAARRLGFGILESNESGRALITAEIARQARSKKLPLSVS